MTNQTMINPDETILNHPLFDEQIKLEEDMRSAGIMRFREQMEKQIKSGEGSQTRPGVRMVEKSHEKMVAAIQGFMTEANSGKPGPKHTAVAYFEKLDVDQLANITARCCLDQALMNPTLTGLSNTLATMLEGEVNSQLFQRVMPHSHKKFLAKAKGETQERRQWSHLLFPAALLGVELEEWPAKAKVLVGMKLVELFIEATGLIESRLVSEGRNTVYMVHLTEGALAWMEEEGHRLESLFPMLMPTIIPPKRWTTPFSGGYYTLQARNLTLIKTFNRPYLEELSTRDMPVVYDAVNALQETPWMVNTAILDVMRTIYDTGSELAGVPAADKRELPQKPLWMPETGKMDRELMSEEQLEELKVWKAAAQQVYQFNGKSKSKRAQYLRTMGVAQKFADAEAIYFPHQIDWRGRAYPMPLYLQPQGSDAQRGLLLFADALPIADQVDADWLAIHGAGMFGFDKASLEDRSAWVDAHEETILACAADPFGCTWWTEADKPWQFLAFCFDWAGFKAEGFGYLSNLPVQMDGTCNGLQNFSAMLLDEVGGAAVNLIPADKPQDIYQRVCDLVVERIMDDLSSSEVITSKHKDEAGVIHERMICTVAEIAAGWLPKMGRKVTKRPVMTLAYGAKRFGFVGQVDEDTIKPWREESPETYPFIRSGDDGKPLDFGYQAATYMGGLIWEAVGKVVIAAREAMDWLQAAAQIVSKENLPINWTTPTGLLVQQAYRVPNMKLVETTFNKSRVRLTYMDGAVGKIDKRRQASGISPNWIHSLDASHLMRTIVRCREEGITAFSMIHDSYGTHAGNAGALALFLREEFVRMYAEVDVLHKFKCDLEAQTDTDLPELPSKGNLDLNTVLESSFFFS